MTHKRFRAAAMFTVFTVSAVVHEYVLAVCFGFFYPVLFCLFMCFGSETICYFKRLYIYIYIHIDNDCSKEFRMNSVISFFPLIVSSVMFNFILHDRRTGPVWNVIVWTALFLGLAVLLCLYSQEWYAQKYCPLQEVNTTAPCTVSHWGLLLLLL